MSRRRCEDGIPDSVLTASWRPGDGPRRGLSLMSCNECKHEFIQQWEREYGQCCPVNNEECPECGSNDIEKGGHAEPDEPDPDAAYDAMIDRRMEKTREKADWEKDE